MNPKINHPFPKWPLKRESMDPSEDDSSEDMVVLFCFWRDSLCKEKKRKKQIGVNRHALGSQWWW